MFELLKDDQIYSELEQINNRIHCKACQNARALFQKEDFKKQGRYSELCIGTASKKIKPLDVLIVSESHGGGGTFRDQLLLKEELESFYEFYVNETPKRTNQYLVHQFLNYLNSQQISWFFTDLIKCFVAKGKVRQGVNNISTATRHCSKYLDQQISVLQPKVILTFGGPATNHFKKGMHRSHLHGNQKKITYLLNGNHTEITLIQSIHPTSQNTNYWVEYGGWAPVVNSLMEVLGKNTRVRTEKVFHL